MVSFPYCSHTTPIRIPKDMGIVWETYHKRVPLLGVPGNTPWLFGRGKRTDAIPCPPFKHFQNKKVEGRSQSKKLTDFHEEITNSHEKAQITMKKTQIPIEKCHKFPWWWCVFFFSTPNFFSSTPALFPARKKPLKIARVSLLKTIEWQWKYEQMNELMCLLSKFRWIFHLPMSVLGVL